jgi:hypothetical protein
MTQGVNFSPVGWCRGAPTPGRPLFNAAHTYAHIFKICDEESAVGLLYLPSASQEKVINAQNIMGRQAVCAKLSARAASLFRSRPRPGCMILTHMAFCNRPAGHAASGGRSPPLPSLASQSIRILTEQTVN